MDVRMLGSAEVLRGAVGDVARQRETHRRRRVLKVGLVLAVIALFFYWRLIGGNPVRFGWPDLTIPAGLKDYLPGFLLIIVLGGVLIVPLATAGRSPHTLYRPSEIPVTLRRRRRPRHRPRRGHQDAQPLPRVTRRSASRWAATRAGRSCSKVRPAPARRTWRRRWRARPAVPFLFVSASAFQSMYYGQTNRKIRSFFKELRKTARREGGAIGFIEEIDAIAGARAGDEPLDARGRRHGPRDRARRRRGHQRRRQRAARADAVVRRVDVRRPDPRLVHRPGEPVPAPEPPDPEEAADGVEHPRHRRDQPGRGPRPRAAAARAASTARSTSTCPDAAAGARSSTTT